MNINDLLPCSIGCCCDSCIPCNSIIIGQGTHLYICFSYQGRSDKRFGGNFQLSKMICSMFANVLHMHRFIVFSLHNKKVCMICDTLVHYRGSYVPRSTGYMYLNLYWPNPQSHHTRVINCVPTTLIVHT